MANRNAGGNARKSRKHHELAGSLRNDRHADLKNPEAPSGRPEMPARLAKAEQAAWNDLMTDLERQGSVTQADGKVAYQYAKLFCETERVAKQQSKASAALRRLERAPKSDEPLSVEVLVARAELTVALHKTVAKCTDQLRQGRMAIRQFLVEFGLTPASRGRIKLPPKAEEKDEFSAFQLKRVK